METIMNQLFSPELIPDYMHAHPEYGVKRILTYTVYRFLSFAGKEDDTLAAYIKETLFPMEDALDFSLIDDYLALDPYFCPVPEEGSFDAFFLYTAISILENAFDEFALGDELAIIDDLILTKYPVLGSVALDDADIRLDALFDLPLRRDAVQKTHQQVLHDNHRVDGRAAIFFAVKRGCFLVHERQIQRRLQFSEEMSLGH